MTPYRGVNGGRRREPDEGRQPRDEVARFATSWRDTGAAIRPGDIIQRAPGGRIVLVKSNAPTR
ncbi:MAG: hypothetical protein LW712_15570 [Burkholderiaceae bacterium]|nr:hypothetical protein [Burkholderiaceae bacterium]